MAEKLRTIIAYSPSPSGEPITISLGISAYQHTNLQPKVIVNRALYALSF